MTKNQKYEKIENVKTMSKKGRREELLPGKCRKLFADHFGTILLLDVFSLFSQNVKNLKMLKK